MMVKAVAFSHSNPIFNDARRRLPNVKGALQIYAMQHRQLYVE